jgi:hypothetical protein
MTKDIRSSSPPLRVPLPLPLSHDGIDFVPVDPSTTSHRLPDETVVAIGMALLNVLESRLQVSSVTSSVWKTMGRLESIQRSER